jgi:hypothetical protein
MSGHGITYLGETTKQENLIIRDGFDDIINLKVSNMVDSWQNTLDMTGSGN